MCKVSTKTFRYNEEISMLLSDEIDPENDYFDIDSKCVYRGYDKN